jgi:hypothetical protein
MSRVTRIQRKSVLLTGTTLQLLGQETFPVVL